MTRETLDPVDFSTLRRPRSPNTFLVAPPDVTPAPVDLAAPEFAVSAQALRWAWLSMLEAAPRVALLEPADAMTVEAVQRTPVLRFPDRITARFIPLPGGRSTLALYSRSRYGRSDLGVNRRRVRAWLTLLERKVAEIQPPGEAHASMPSPKVRK